MKLIRLFITYIKENRKTGEIYAGRASGKFTGNEERDAVKIMKKRDASHHKNKEGYELGQIDKISTNGDAIRGREQMLIDKLKEESRSGNKRNGIGHRNKKRNKYLKAALKLFGAISIILLFLYLCNII